MNASDRARRAAMLCCHFARNFAYYSFFRSSSIFGVEGFWLTVHGNFLDVCVLEWCKLFGNRNGKFHWKNATLDPNAFRRELLNTHGIDDAALDKLWNEMKNYRDDFVAHLDEQETTAIPNLNGPYLLTTFYFEKLQSDFTALQTHSSLPQQIYQYYDLCLKQADEVLQGIKGSKHG